MNTELALWKVVVSMPESLKKELLDYAEYLQKKYPTSQPSEEKIETHQDYGNWKGQIMMSDELNSMAQDGLMSEKMPQPGLNLGAMVMSDDFDQPLPDEFWLQNL